MTASATPENYTTLTDVTRTPTQPTLKRSIFGKCSAWCRDCRAADRLLLPTQMVFKKLVPSDVAGVHARNGMVH